MRSVGVLSLMLVSAFADAAVQEPPALHAGQLVRISAPGVALENVKASVVWLRRDTLLLRHERLQVDEHGRHHRDSVVTDVPFAAITRLAVSSGKRSRATTGMLIGGTSMFFIGLISTAAYYSSDEEGYTRYLIGGAFIPGAIGAGFGWLIGSAIKTDKWEEVPLDRLRVSITPTGRGFGIGARIAF
jgi:hypothetical protein